MAEADASEEMDVVVEMEEVHVADEFVIEVSPESIEDALLNSFCKSKENSAHRNSSTHRKAPSRTPC